MKLQKETSKKNGSSQAARHGRWYDDACGTAFAMELVGERWTLLIVRELMFGPRRFSDLRASLPGISAKTLTERLEAMQGAGIALRRELPSPGRVQVYELTEWGYRAEIAVMELGRWAALSPGHDPTLPLSAASMMMSLRTMLLRDALMGEVMTIGFDIGEKPFWRGWPMANCRSVASRLTRLRPYSAPPWRPSLLRCSMAIFRQRCWRRKLA